MTLWDDVPSSARNSGALDQVRPLLQGLTGTDDGLQTDDDGTWHVYTATGTWPTPITLDPGSGGFGNGGTTSTTPIEFPDPSVSVELGLHQTGGVGDGGWRVTLRVPIVLVRLPFLRGAELDGQGQLRANGLPVTFTLPSLRIRAKQLAGQSVGVELLSAETGGTPVDHIYEFISMNPPYALVGPSDVVGFAFRTAVLDLSGTAGPNVPAVPAEARSMPADWQGFYLPEARLFVAPTGLTGLAVSAGVRSLWIGLGVHAGVTGIFEAEVVNRGAAPVITVSFRTASGEWIGDPGTGAAELPEHATIFVDTAGGLAPITHQHQRRRRRHRRRPGRAHRPVQRQPQHHGHGHPRHGLADHPHLHRGPPQRAHRRRLGLVDGHGHADEQPAARHTQGVGDRHPREADDRPTGGRQLDLGRWSGRPIGRRPTCRSLPARGSTSRPPCRPPSRRRSTRSSGSPSRTPSTPAPAPRTTAPSVGAAPPRCTSSPPTPTTSAPPAHRPRAPRPPEVPCSTRSPRRSSPRSARPPR